MMPYISMFALSLMMFDTEMSVNALLYCIHTRMMSAIW